MFVEDVSVLFASWPAVAATLDGSAVRGIFDNAYDIGMASGISVAGTSPRLQLASASVPVNPVGKTIVVGSVNYIVATHESDGTGVSLLHLERVP